MPDSHFSFSADQLKQIARDVLDYAAKRGASAAESEVSEGFGQTVTVRQGEVETIEYNRDKGIGVTVYIGKQRGHASTTDFSPQALRDTVDAALSIARFTAADDCAGLADPDMLARDIPDLDLWHPWDLPVERAIELAQACEAAGFAVDKRLTNSEGATVSTQRSHFVYGNTLGFLAGYPSSRHGIWCALIAGKNDEMQRDDWYETGRDAAELPDPASRGAPRRRARRAPACRAQDRNDAGAGAVRGADRLQPARAFRVGGVRRQPLSQVLVPARQRRQAVFAPLVNMSEQPHVTERPRQRAVRRGGRGDARARGGEGRRGAGLFSRQLLGAQAGAASPPATPAATTT